MPREIVPLRQQYHAVGIEALQLERIHAADHRFGFQIDDGYRSITHSRKVEQRVLHEGIASVLGEGNVMRTLRRGDRFEELWLRRPGAQVENVEMSRLRGCDVHAVRF